LRLSLRRLKFTSVIAAGLLAVVTGSSAGDLPTFFAGGLVGSVIDSLGTPQMGATVQLFDRYQRLVRKSMTSGDGRFGFAGLMPEVYSVRVAVPSFLPAARDKIAIRAGLSSVLQVRLTSVLSTVEVQYTAPTGVMSDDWKWVLRSSNATRAITRDLPLPTGLGSSTSSEDPKRIFAGTRGLVSLSAGDAGSLLSDVGNADFGTSFAVSTSLYGRNHIDVSGGLGQSISGGMPTMGVRATYSRNDSDGEYAMPELTVMMRQVALPNRPGYIAAAPDGLASVRSSAVSYYDALDALGFLHIEYGTSLDTVSFADRLSRVSPFVRATASLGAAGSLAAVYSNGGAPNDLYIHQFGADSDLAGTVSSLSNMPEFSFRDGRLQLQRTKNFELGYLKTAGSRTYGISGFYENVNDGRLTVAGNLSSLDSGDVLPDFSTRTSIYNIGHYNRNGVIASMDQKIGNSLDLAFAGGTMGGFSAQADATPRADSFLRRSSHAIASFNIRSILPGTNTRLFGNYEYVADGAVVPRHIFSTQRLYTEPGLNLIVRQPLPSFWGIGRLELSADLRNLLAQGYIPVASGQGRQLLVVQAPRAVRGGLNFIF
jgi:Carboxypeptidase regulatory-like domain